jgi:CheY-like chemotaxis protein
MAHQVAEYEAAGMDALAPKPIQMPQLLAVIQQAIAKAEAARAAAA